MVARSLESFEQRLLLSTIGPGAAQQSEQAAGFWLSVRGGRIQSAFPRTHQFRTAGNGVSSGNGAGPFDPVPSTGNGGSGASQALVAGQDTDAAPPTLARNSRAVPSGPLRGWRSR